MTDTDDIDSLAAEYVLGTLDPNERRDVAMRRRNDLALDAAIMAWEARLAPLNGLYVETAPPGELKAQIMERITRPAAGADAANVVRLERRIGRWRSAALGMTALAASLAGFIVVREVLRPAAPRSFVAVLQKDAQSPAFLMTVDVESRTFVVRAVSPEKNPGKSYELWLVNQRLGPPKSLGLIGDKAYSAGVKLANFTSGDIEEATYAVSIEPEGGSPTGAPTGPVVYAGKLVQARP